MIAPPPVTLILQPKKKKKHTQFMPSSDTVYTYRTVHMTLHSERHMVHAYVSLKMIVT